MQFERGLLALQSIVLQLQGLDTATIASLIPLNSSLSTVPQPADYAFLPASQAEGLLAASVTIIKQLPPGFLLPQWPLYFRTFKFYLGHPASTVRQAASGVFKHIVARDASNPVIAKLVLQGLAAHWPVTREGVDVGKIPVLPSALTWQAKEGRLLAYDLILSFLISNHQHYLFPSMLIGAPSAATMTTPQSKPRRYVTRDSIDGVNCPASYGCVSRLLRRFLMPEHPTRSV